MNNFYRIIYIIIIFLFFSVPPSALSAKISPSAREGILDLRGWDFEQDGSLDLNGEWQFFWNQLLSPEEIASSQSVAQPEYQNLPGKWNNFKTNGNKLGGYGYATYKLTILHDQNIQNLAFEIKEMATAYALFIDGRAACSNGIVGTSRSNMVPEYRPVITHYTPLGNRTDIILQISNFDHKDGGPTRGITLGTAEQLHKEKTFRAFINIFLIGSILTMGLYHLSLFLLKGKYEGPFYFGIFCCMIALRSSLTNERYLHILCPDFSWGLLLKLEYLTFYLAVPIFVTYIAQLFPEESHKKTLRFIQGFGLIFSLITIISPVHIFSHTLQIYQILTILAGMFILYVLLKAYIHRRDGVLVVLFGFGVLFLTAIYDILGANYIIQTEFFLQSGLFIFIFSQAYLLSLMFSKTLTNVENQKNQLAAINIDLEKEIIHRAKLEENLIESHQRYQNSRVALILGLAKLAEYRDEDTGAHLERIREYTKVIAIELSKKPEYEKYITKDYINDIYQSSILHDIGKVGIQDVVLLKPGKLTDEEFEIIKTHTIIGGDAIAAVESQSKVRSFLTLAKDIAYSHHEKWDGSGYPKGLKGKEIPLSARIASIADIYDALTSERSYKKAFTHEKAMHIILNESEGHFDSKILEAFKRQSRLFEAIRKNLID